MIRPVDRQLLAPVQHGSPGLLNFGRGSKMEFARSLDVRAASEHQQPICERSKCHLGYQSTGPQIGFLVRDRISRLALRCEHRRLNFGEGTTAWSVLTHQRLNQSVRLGFECRMDPKTNFHGRTPPPLMLVHSFRGPKVVWTLLSSMLVATWS